jgi:valyl-tRNA synthetase
VPDAATHALLLAGESRRVARLTNVEHLQLHLAAATPRVPQSAVGVGNGFEVRVPLTGVVDVAAETARIDKELAKVDGDLEGIEKKLSNPNFVARAPAEVVEKDRARADELRTTRQKLINHRAVMSGADQPLEETPVETNNPNPPSQPVVEKVEHAAAAVVEAAKEAAHAVQTQADELEKKAAPTIRKARRAVKKAVASARKGVADARKAVKKGVAGARKAVTSARKKLAKKAPRKAARKAPRKAVKKVARKPAARKAKK